MKIQFNKIDKLGASYQEISEILTPDICAIIDEDEISSNQHFLRGDDEGVMLYKIYFQLDSILPLELFIEARAEIDLNLAIIEHDSQISRYLTLIRAKVDTLLELMQDLTEFRKYRLKYWGDAAWETMEDDASLQNINNGGFALPVFLIPHNNPLVNLRIMYLYLIYSIGSIRDYIDEKLFPGKEFQTMQSLPIESWPEHLRMPRRNGFYHPGTRSIRPKFTPPTDSESGCIYKLEDIFYPKFKKHCRKFFKALNDHPKKYIKDDGSWDTQAYAYYFYKELNKSGRNIVLPSFEVSGIKIRDSNVKRIFENEFKVLPSNFRGDKVIATQDVEKDFKGIIDSVTSSIPS